jgi:hypothetical protein
MGQTAPRRFQILIFAGMNNIGWSAVSPPASMNQCHKIVLRNLDGSNLIYVCTDPNDASSVDTVEAQSSFEFEMSSSKPLAGLGPGEQIFFIKGAGSQPLVYYYE